MNCSPYNSGSSSNYPSGTIPNTAIYDSFNRMVTETPTTILTSHVSFTPQYEIMGYVSSAAGSIFVDISNCIVQLSTTTAGRAIRQTLEYQIYQPGKVHQAYLTWTPHYLGTFDNFTAVRCGIYDDYRDKNTPSGTMGPPPYSFISSIHGGKGQETNRPSMGHYFELSGNSWFVVERANSFDNLANVTRIPQSDWNIDTLNGVYGRNPSGVTLPTNREGLFFIERQWLGVGVVRFGVHSAGKKIICHEISNRGIKTPYTITNKVPIRYEIEKVAGGSSAPVATASICMASQIDGEYIPLGAIFSLPSALVYSSTRVSGIIKPVLCIRLAQKYCRATLKIKDIQVYGSAPGLYSIFKNPSISGSINWVKHPDAKSMVEYARFDSGTAIPLNTLSGGSCINTGFFSTRTVILGNQSLQELLVAPSITSDVAGVPDVWCIGMMSLSGNSDVNASCSWLEIT